MNHIRFNILKRLSCSAPKQFMIVNRHMTSLTIRRTLFGMMTPHMNDFLYSVSISRSFISRNITNNNGNTTDNIDSTTNNNGWTDNNINTHTVGRSINTNKTGRNINTNEPSNNTNTNDTNNNSNTNTNPNNNNNTNNQVVSQESSEQSRKSYHDNYDKITTFDRIMDFLLRLYKKNPLKLLFILETISMVPCRVALFYNDIMGDIEPHLKPLIQMQINELSSKSIHKDCLLEETEVSSSDAVTCWFSRFLYYCFYLPCFFMDNSLIYLFHVQFNSSLSKLFGKIIANKDYNFIYDANIKEVARNYWDLPENPKLVDALSVMKSELKEYSQSMYNYLYLNFNTNDNNDNNSDDKEKN